jgi:hypothetical protein
LDHAFDVFQVLELHAPELFLDGDVQEIDAAYPGLLLHRWRGLCQVHVHHEPEVLERELELLDALTKKLLLNLLA